MVVAFEQILEVVLRESNYRRNIIFVAFAVISLSFLIVGYSWPKIYTTHSDVYVSNTNILQPLMRGAAETTQSIDHVKNAKEIIYGDKIMDQIISEVDWIGESPSDFEKEVLKKSIKEKVRVKKKGESLISITYQNANPEHAFFITKRLAELFVEAGEKSKVVESQSAFDFISQQVNEYLDKLTVVEEALREYRSDNPDARPGLENEVSASITRLQRGIENAKMELSETNIKKVSILEQLSGEAAIAISQSKEGQYNTKIALAQEKLEVLRLSYKETYPDILRLKSQIEDLKAALNNEISNRKKAISKAQKSGELFVDESIAVNPLYQQLRSNLSTTETEIRTLNARINSLIKNLDREHLRARKIFGGEAKLTKLTRDYEVNQQIYQDLLKRLESARVSKRLDELQDGLTFNILEPAKIPLLPTGARFLHFLVAGLLLGVLVPIVLIYALVQIDPRVRFSKIISKSLDVPVLAEINTHITISEEKMNQKNLIVLGVGVLIVLVIYGIAGWIKFFGVAI